MKNLIGKIFSGKNNYAFLPVVLCVLIFVILGCSNFKKDKNTSTTSSPSTSPTTKVDAATPKQSFTKADASKGEMPSDPELQQMVKATLTDFNKAVSDDDFTDFFDTISKPWKKQTSPAELKKSFQGFIDKKIDISDIRSLDAKFSPEPVIEKELGYKTLKLVGRYPTSPNSTKFLVSYIPDGKDWKLSRIEVDTTAD
jgi:hypothetical protein